MSKQVEKYNYRVLLTPHRNSLDRVLCKKLVKKLGRSNTCLGFDITLEHDTREVCSFCGAGWGGDWSVGPPDLKCCCVEAQLEYEACVSHNVPYE